MKMYCGKFLGTDGLVRYISDEQTTDERNSVKIFDPKNPAPFVFSITKDLKKAKLFVDPVSAKKVLGHVKAFQRKGNFQKISSVQMEENKIMEIV